jgi:long-chain acyl-CoA synthetase
VPLDAQLSLSEVHNLARSSAAKVAVFSYRVAERLLDDASIEYATGRPHATLAESFNDLDVEICAFEDLLDEPESSTAIEPVKRVGKSVASLIYTSGTTGDPKGVMLSDKNLTSMAAKLSQLFRLDRHDGLLSVLPLHHTFEFSAGFLMPLLHGSQITYLEEITPDSLGDTLRGGNITGMVGVPALWQLLHRRIVKQIADRGPVVRRVFDTIVDFNRRLRDRVPYEWNLGKVLFFPVHRRFGGRMRLLISGGSALSPEVMKSFQGMGFKLYEGYGMTEASPVITVQRPGDKSPAGSVGRALPGIDVKIESPDEHGVGEVVAKGPNVMAGYYGNEEATSEVIRNGWLHTGDLGRVDEDGNLFIVGRKKEMILGSSGENVYPDELEELYGDTDDIKELSVVGLPNGDGTETVAGMVVPDYEQTGTREQIRNRVREHLKTTSAKLPQYKRLKVAHLWDHDLPKTATRKIKRREVVAELTKLERAAGAAGAVDVGTTEQGGSADWIRDVIASVSQKSRGDVTAGARLEQLGFDSLMYTELAVALEANGIAIDSAEVNDLETVSEVENYVAAKGKRKAGAAKVVKNVVNDDDIHVPAPIVKLGRETLGKGQRALYSHYLNTQVTGAAHVPPFGGYIVAANHASHLDMGLAKYALGESGDSLVALAAKDYFFDDPVRRAYFENFTNLVPMERHGSLRESLRLAGETIRDGYALLIFPEGTRSTTGIMIDFKPSLGYLAMANRCGILPMFLSGAHGLMPKGSYLPKRGDVGAHVGPFLRYEDLCELTEGMGRAQSYRHIATHVEGVVRSLAPDDHEWALGESGRLAVAEWEKRQEGGQ